MVLGEPENRLVRESFQAHVSGISDVHVTVVVLVLEDIRGDTVDHEHTDFDHGLIENAVVVGELVGLARQGTAIHPVEGVALDTFHPEVICGRVGNDVIDQDDWGE